MKRVLIDFRLVFLAGLLALLGTAQLSAQSESALVARMEVRLPELMKLKLAGKVGENNAALVEARAAIEREERRLVAEENRERMALYRLIAERIGVPVDNVQRSRAEDIRESSPRGVWVQSPSGDWYREPGGGS